MTPTFADLVLLYRTSKPQGGLDVRSFDILTAEDLALVTNLSSDEYFDKTGLNILTTDNLEEGQTITIEFNQPKAVFGRFYGDLAAFIKGDIAQIHSCNIHESQYFIKSEDIASFDITPNEVVSNYELVKKLLLQLMVMNAYTDTINQKLIFFSKKTFELSFNITPHIQDFINTIKKLKSEDKDVIKDFTEWLKDEATGTHIDEKKAILAFVLADALPNNASIITVSQQIQHISQAVQAQYALYLENFSYEKFVKKLDENKEKFVTRINDTISKVSSQFLSLPFLTAVPTALKSADNWIIYLALAIYCFICASTLENQNQLLKYIEQDIEDYSSDGKLPDALSKKWASEKGRITPLLKKQKRLYLILAATVFACYLYAVFKLAYIN